MKKQTKLVAVLSTAALLAIGASMTSFAATGWAEEDGTWVYYNRDGERATDSWKKSGNNWYYLDSDGEMAIDQLIEDGDNYYYVDINGVMASNQWVAIENEDAGEDDEPEHYWYYFQANGKALTNGDNDKVSLKTINGKKYAFDNYGAMVAEWSLNDKDLSKVNGYGDNFTASLSEAGTTIHVASGNQVVATRANATSALNGAGNDAQYTRVWKYFNSVEDGARVSKGWFKVVSAEMINAEKYDDDEDAWYYADGSGNLYAGEFKTIKGKKYAFRNDGRMLSGLKFILENDNDLLVKADDDGSYPFDNEDDFLANAANYYEGNGYKCYYFGDGEDGAMRTGKLSVSIDGENQNFYFQKSGGKKGAGLTGEKDDKLYQSGMLLKAGSDEKYQVVKKEEKTKIGSTDTYTTYVKLDDAKAFMEDVVNEGGSVSSNLVNGVADEADVAIGNGATKKAKDLTESYSITLPTGGNVEYILVNTSGKIIDKKGKSKDGNDYNYVTDTNGTIKHLYVED